MRFLVAEIRDANPLKREGSFDALTLLGKAPAMVAYKGPVTTKVQATMTHEGEVVFTGKVESLMTFQCGRCLEPFDRVVKADFQQVISPEGTEVDITNEIRETVFLDLPVSAVCKETCKGICPGCGINRNNATCACVPATDVRWDGLKQLKI